MKHLLLFAILSLLVSCSNTKNKDMKIVRGIAIVEGIVNNFENGSKVISFSGETISGEINQISIIDSLGKFRAEIELLHPQNVTLSYENGWAYLYLKPDDSLFIEFNLNSLEQNLYQVSGSNSTTSEYIRDFYKFHGSYSYEPKYGDSVTVKEYLNDLKEQMSVEDSVLSEFSNQHNPNEEFMHWAKKNLKYGVAGNLLLYYWHFDVNRKQLKPEVFDTDIFPVDDDSAIVSGNYLYHLKEYVLTNYYRDSVVIEVYEKKGVAASFNYMFDRIINNEKPSLSRNIMIYRTLLILLEQPINEVSDVWERYEYYISNKVLVDILRAKKSRIESQDNDNETTLNLKLTSKSEKIQKFWKTLSTKHKDRIIYVDIWATWCGPCRGEIPHAIDLQDYYEGKHVAFVNLCLASKKENWKKSITQNHIKGDNYFFNEDETKLLRDELNFHGYPTYMIIDKEGNIINKNAPRPSSGEEIKNILNKLLNEQ